MRWRQTDGGCDDKGGAAGRWWAGSRIYLVVDLIWILQSGKYPGRAVHFSKGTHTQKDNSNGKPGVTGQFPVV